MTDDFSFPEDWILPGEFSFGPSGAKNTLRVGPASLDRIKENNDIVRSIYIFRSLLATARRRNVLPKKFWTINKTEGASWEEWLKQFPPYYIDYKQVPRKETSWALQP